METNRAALPGPDVTTRWSAASVSFVRLGRTPTDGGVFATYSIVSGWDFELPAMQVSAKPHRGRALGTYQKLKAVHEISES